MDLWSETDLSPAFALILEALITVHLANPGVGQYGGRRLSEQAYWRRQVSFPPWGSNVLALSATHGLTFPT